VKPSPLQSLETIYTRSSDSATGKANHNSTSEIHPEGQHCEEEILIQESDGKRLAKVLEAPELAAEVERAVAQVKYIIKKRKEA
jgi:hypothetical protein